MSVFAPPSTSPIDDPASVSSPLSGGLTSPATLRSAAYTIQTSLYDGLYDGSYRTLPSPLESSYVAKSARSWEPDLTCSKIIQEFDESKLFDESRLKKLRSKALRRYNRALLKQKRMILKSLGSPNGLMSFNGEYIAVELQICEVNWAQISLAEELRDSYQRVLTLVKIYQDPYNLESEKRAAEKVMMGAFYEFDDVLQKLRYLDTQKEGLLESLEVQRVHVGVRGWIHKVFER